jgi:hypothetical protein
MVQKKLPSISRLKQAAKKLVKQTHGLTHVAALDMAARECGFEDYASFREAEKLQQEVRVVPLKAQEQAEAWFREEATKRGQDFSVFIPTENGLTKSILDATSPVRLHFATTGFHDYSAQQKGLGHRVRKQAYFVTSDGLMPRTVSLYRPETKDGDPRMWFNGLREFARPDDKIAIVIDEGTPLLFNLAELAVEFCRTWPLPTASQLRFPLQISETAANYESTASDSNVAIAGAVVRDAFWPLTMLPPRLEKVLSTLEQLGLKLESHSQALLRKLDAIAKRGPLRAISAGDTAVGMAVENALGIKPNSRREPDYQNRIEIKAARQKEKGMRTRQTLFAQVADWGHPRTAFKSSAAILDRFGYQREDVFKLYCTISAVGSNSQGLSFKVSDDGELLLEVHKDEGIVAAWPVALLAQRLLQKHSETFWVEAKSARGADGAEYFTLMSARHTTKPLVSQLLPLIRNGHVTMDHLIKRREDGSVQEKGPLFKVSPEGFKYLFPTSTPYKFSGNTE